MPYTATTLPLTGAGDATAQVAVDNIGGALYQAMKIFSAEEGSTLAVVARSSAPSSTDVGLVVRPITSTDSVMAVVGAVAQAPGSTSIAPWYVISTAATGGPGSSAVDANLTSAGSTKTIGVVSQGSPGGSSADAWWVRTVTTGAAGAGSTTVDANLTSAGSTKIVGIYRNEPFSSGAITRSTVNSSAEAQLFAANAARLAVTITNMATAVSLFVGMSTAAVTTAGANAHFIVPALQTYTMGGGVLGALPRYTGPLRVRVNSTTVAGPVIGVEYV